MPKSGPPFASIRLFLTENADPIQKEATNLHKKYLGTKYLRIESIAKYQNKHIEAVEKIAHYLIPTKFQSGVRFFGKLGEDLGREAVQDGLSIEEAIDGTIYLKQAVWNKLNKAGLLRDLTTTDFYTLNQTLGTFIDTFASKLAFAYHKQRQYIEGNLNYLAESSKILSSSLDYQTTLNTIALLAVPKIADWCAVELVDGKGIPQQVAVAHKDPKKITWAKELRKSQKMNMDAPTGVPNVLKTGKSELYPHITDEMLVASSRTKQELKLTRGLGITSAIIVPLFSQEKPIGAITFVTTESRRHYNQVDLVMAEEIAVRASVAIENAKLYKGSQDAITVRDEFISVASHELKTPVTSVKMFAQVLKKHSEQIGDTKAVDHLTKMDKQLNKLTELIYDLLNVSKIQAGKMEFKHEFFDFDQAMEEVINVLQQSASKHKLIVKGKTKKKVYGDEERLGQVMNNLVSNAIKYSPKAIKILINLSSDKKNVQVSVQDRGIGISKEHFSRIFERFYRAYNGNDKTYPGLGIGLYISSEIVKRHGGRMWVESSPGKGSVFTFSIPIDIRKK